MSTQMTYWGVLCRECSEPVPFGAPSHQQFELESAYARPGAIRCAKGHNYIYFPRDFNFFSSAEEIPEAVMQHNRDVHGAINRPAVAPPEHLSGKRWVAGEASKASMPHVPTAAAAAKKVSPAISGPDPRRAAAQAAAKEWWTKWAAHKAS
jgi:hypothetical protein